VAHPIKLALAKPQTLMTPATFAPPAVSTNLSVGMKAPSFKLPAPQRREVRRSVVVMRKRLPGLLNPRPMPVRIKIPKDKSFKRYLRAHKKYYWGYTRVLLRRSGMYGKMMREIFRREGVPTDLIMQSGAESAYYTRVISPAHAAGVWQFIPRTGRSFGLKINRWVDERRNIEKATIAAARYMKSLYQRFGQWELAVAGYNCGPHCIKWLLRRCPDLNFWKMRRRMSCHMPPETANYVAKIYALMYYARNIKKEFQKPIRKSEPVVTVKVWSKHPIFLADAAKFIGLPAKQLWFLNPELSTWVTPPGKRYPLLVPPAFADKAREYVKLGPKRFRLRAVAVKPGQWVARIARRYRLSIKTLNTLNRFWGRRVPKKMHHMIVPLPRKGRRWTRRSRWIVRGLLRDARVFIRSHRSARRSQPPGVCYKAKRGDSFTRISRRFRIPMVWLRRYNAHLSGIRPGVIVKLRQWARCSRKGATRRRRARRSRRRSRR
jgi:membrane-bound lytic murein transglycosylase D